MRKKSFVHTLGKVQSSKGLHQVIRNARGASLRNLHGIVVGSHHDQRQRRGLSIRPYGAQKLQARSTRHIPVAKNQVELFGVDQVPSHFRALGLRNVNKPQVFKHPRHNQTHRRGIIDHQNLFGLSRRQTHSLQNSGSSR